VFCPNAVEWGDFAAWVGAIATVLAAIGTVGTLIWTVRQTVALRREAAHKGERAQAESVCAWIHGDWAVDNTTFRLRNGSHEPVYNAVVDFVWLQGAAWHTAQQAPEGLEANRIRAILQVLPPGDYTVDIAGPTNHVTQGAPGVELAFTDAANRNWVRGATGQLDLTRRFA
jgi:hypothetical protein